MHMGPMEIFLILLVAILLFGGKRIPEIARGLGRASYEFKKAKAAIKEEADELKKEIDEAANEQEQKQITEQKEQ